MTAEALWASSIPEVAFVSGGIAVAKKAGQAIVTATYGGKTSNPATLTVANDVVALEISPTESTINVSRVQPYVVDAEKVVFSWVNGVERQCSD